MAVLLKSVTPWWISGRLVDHFLDHFLAGLSEILGQTRKVARTRKSGLAKLLIS